MPDETAPFGRARMPDWGDVVHWLTAFALTVVGFVTLIGNRIHAAGNDAVFTQGLVDRAQRLGGAYYQNGITPKGPLEDVAHDLALRLGGYNGHWYVMSVLVAITAPWVLFFALLPQMHERYLVFAAGVACCLTAALRQYGALQSTV